MSRDAPWRNFKYFGISRCVNYGSLMHGDPRNELRLTCFVS